MVNTFGLVSIAMLGEKHEPRERLNRTNAFAALRPRQQSTNTLKNGQRFALASLFALTMISNFYKFLPDSGALTSDSGSIPNQIIWGATYLLIIWKLHGIKDQALTLARNSLPLIVLTCFFFISFAWSVEPYVTARSAIEMIGQTALCYYFVARFSYAQILNMLLPYFGLDTILSLVLAIIWPSHGRSSFGVVGWSGLYAEKNGLGAAMSLTILTLAACISSKVDKRRLQMIALLLFASLFTLIQSRSLTAIVVLIATLVIVGGLICYTRVRARFTMILTLLTIGGICFGIVVDSSKLAPIDLLSQFGKSPTLSGRGDFWPGLQLAISERPILGYGFNAFFSHQSAIDTYIRGVNGWWIPANAHNTYYQLLLDGGYVAVILFVLSISSSIIRAIQMSNSTNPIAASWPLAIIIYSLIGSFTEVYVAIPNWIGSFCFTIAILLPLKKETCEIQPSKGSLKRSATAANYGRKTVL